MRSHLVVLVFVLCAFSAHAQESGNVGGLSESHYRWDAVTPEIVCSEESQSISDHPLSFTLEVSGYGHHFKVAMAKNDILIPASFVVGTYDGSNNLKTSTVNRPSRCHYQGVVNAIREEDGALFQGSAAINTCAGDGSVSGLLIIDGQEYTMEPHPYASHVAQGRHIMYRPSDRRDYQPINNDAGGHFDERRAAEIETGVTMTRAHRAVSETKFERPKWLELLVIVDHGAYTGDYGSSVDAAVASAANIANLMDTKFNVAGSSLNTRVVLSSVVVWTDSDKIDYSSTEVGHILDETAHYVQGLMDSQPDTYAHDSAALFSSKDFTKDGNSWVTGLGNIGALCNVDGEGAGANINELLDTELAMASLVAHEVGHTMNMRHDGDGNSCSNAFIMGNGDTSFSTCSIDYWKLYVDHGYGDCVLNEPTRFAGELCGNGFVEGAEECDPGGEENGCCNPTTCKLTTGSKCGSGECCNLSKCKFKSSNSQCRPSYGACDVEEFCTGTEALCPENLYGYNGQSCEDSAGNAGYCYEGNCPTRHDTCYNTWVSDVSGNVVSDAQAECYGHNTWGSQAGNCGFQAEADCHLVDGWCDYTFTACETEDKYCGVLQCASSTCTGGSCASDTPGTFRWSQWTPNCLTMFTGTDRTFVRDGTMCADNKVCLGQKCVPQSNIDQEGACPTKNGKTCNGMGTCTNLGTCVCESDWNGDACECVKKVRKVKNLSAWHDDAGLHVTYKDRSEADCEQIKIREANTNNDWVFLERCGEDKEYLFKKDKITKKLGWSDADYGSKEVSVKVTSKKNAEGDCKKVKSRGKKVDSQFTN
eukprot:TRINITY_DN3635_c0_g1_i1.p1 TRINITY_DN3635_c0_g1~~TRINITY_DN3635_c0_g1_i1.p1  ORF type:complete len:874 (-),score=163.89 TRINITY_DN3635_c0_g1_i1:24-2474(-)